MSDSNDLTTAFDNMKLFTQDHLITSLRPDLREGVLEASQILEKEILRLKTENANLENKLELKHAENLNLERSPETGVKDVENLNPERSSEPGVKHVENLNLERSPETRVKDAENLNLERSPEPGVKHAENLNPERSTEPGSDTKSQSIQSFPSKADTSEVISENYGDVALAAWSKQHILLFSIPVQYVTHFLESTTIKQKTASEKLTAQTTFHYLKIIKSDQIYFH
ncbi:uncharacterized protein [Halyomorpha halys]|uniref:uncharacterized protein isoform X2 n=1 Tax=Halyomorpha halys TaxID=286706 RepID=UPI000D0C850C|nr:uncharacterized protein LOC106682982 isoform X2 [Halyomorpha halys]